MEKQLTITRRWILFFMIALFLSGLTAIPLETELEWMRRLISTDNWLYPWFDKVYSALVDTNQRYPFLAYGYDWLAFAHFVLAILFFGPYRDPVRNKWVIEFAMIACLLVIPFAFIMGAARNIPLGWRLIDCSFGVIGMIPLLIVYKKIYRMEETLKYQDHADTHS